MNAADLAASIGRPGAWRRALLWGLLLALLGVAQTLLVVLTVRHEADRAQDDTDNVAGEIATLVRSEMLLSVQRVQSLGWGNLGAVGWKPAAGTLLASRRELLRVERRDPALAVTDAIDTPLSPRLFSLMPRESLSADAEVACQQARREAAPTFSRSYFVPQPGGHGLEVLDLCVPLLESGREHGFLVASYAMHTLLEAAMAARQTRGHEISFVEADGTRLARAGASRGAGVYRAERVIDLPEARLQVRADSIAGRPSLIPNLATALVLGLSIGLFGVALMLARDGRRRAAAESALAEALAFRKAMEDSLVTGLRARDLDGAIRYVNPAFCAMVGYTADELRSAPVPPYWPPEHAEVGRLRQNIRAGTGPAQPGESREGHETVFMRRNGERFPVMIYEAPLVDRHGRQTGWMSAVLDLSAQRRVEDLSRQQLDRLQATARLATVGEMASLLSHELNQPLSAIASYASGSLNLIDDAVGVLDMASAPRASERTSTAPSRGDGGVPPATLALLRQGTLRIAEQAERAGRVIRSVHDFVRRREHQREPVSAAALLDAVLPLARLQARKSGTRIEIDLPPAGEPAPRVLCDRTMLEQVLLNLSRNAIQAMETAATAAADRVLTLQVRQADARWVAFTVVDAGPGIAPDVAARLFTPFFTTRAEGMGLGLSLCRTVVEQHGGVLDHAPGPGGVGTAFRFTLPAARPVVVDGGLPHEGSVDGQSDESGETPAPSLAA